MWYAYKHVGKTLIHIKLKKNSDRHFKMYLEDVVKVENYSRMEWCAQ
jgi:IS1 family transposase